MLIFPGRNKQAQEVTFTKKYKNICHPPLIFNNTKVSQSTTQKNLDLILHNTDMIPRVNIIGRKVSKASSISLLSDEL